MKPNNLDCMISKFQPVPGHRGYSARRQVSGEVLAAGSVGADTSGVQLLLGAESNLCRGLAAGRMPRRLRRSAGRRGRGGSVRGVGRRVLWGRLVQPKGQTIYDVHTGGEERISPK